MKIGKAVLVSLIFMVPALILPRFALADDWIHTVIQTNKLDTFTLGGTLDYAGFSFDGCTGDAGAKTGKWEGKHCTIALKIGDSTPSSQQSYVFLDVASKADRTSHCAFDLGISLDYMRRHHDPNGYIEKIWVDKGDGCSGNYKSVALKKIDESNYQLIVEDN